MTAAGGGVVLLNMLLGEVSPGGTGSGLYGILIAAILATFVAGLMVGRTPEFLGKKIGATGDDATSSLYVLTTPALVLIGVGIGHRPAEHPGRDEQLRRARLLRGLLRLRLGRQQQRQRVRRDHGHLDVLPAHPGRRHAASGGSCRWSWCSALAGSLARAGTVPRTAGTLPTHTPLFVSLLIGVILLVTGSPSSPGSRSGPSRRHCMTTTTHHWRTKTRTSRADRTPAARRVQADRSLFGGQLLHGRAGRAAQARPRAPVALPGDVHRLARVGAHHRAGRRRPEPLHARHRGLALADGDLRQPGRGRRRGSGQGPGGLAAGRPDRHHRPPARQPTAPRREVPSTQLRARRPGPGQRPARSSPATATWSRASPAWTSRPSPASPPRSSVRPAATARR